MTYYYFFDERDADVFFNMYDNAKFNYLHYFGSENIDFVLKNQTSTQYIESKRENVNKLFDAEVVDMVEGVINVMGSYYYDN